MIVDLLASLSVTSWVVLVTFVITAYYQSTRSKDSNPKPPTPGIALPILGHTYILKKNPIKQFREWRKTLGDVFFMQMGKRRVYVINGFENIKHALVKQGDRVSDRPPGALAHIVHDSRLGVLTACGADWKEQRTVSLSILREFGMGKNMLALKIAEEAEDYLKDLTSIMGSPQDIRLLTNMHISNIICSIIFGRRFDVDDPQFVRLMNIFNEQVQKFSQSSVIIFLPWLRHIPGDPFGVKVALSNYYESNNFVKKMIKDNLKSYDPETMISYSSAYVREMEKKKEAGVETHLGDDSLMKNVAHLFLAGTETASSTILWFLLLMLHNPTVQEKIFQEIKREIGLDRVPTMADKPKLKFLYASIMETQRFANILPLNLNHYTTGPIEVQGYTIPEASTVMPVLDSVLMDKGVWGDPKSFRPERFLDAEGNIVKREELIPFSIGRRVCLGEALAKMELFLFLSSAMQRFKFYPEDPKNLPPLQQLFGATCPPLPYNLLWEKR